MWLLKASWFEFVDEEDYKMIKKIAIILLVMFVLSILALFGMNPSYMMSNSIVWLTIFILPWIILYWLIRGVKGLEKNR